MDELLPVVTATLSTPEEVADTVERALGDGVALLVLDGDLEPAAQYVVELQCAALAAPISLLGVLAGDTVLGYTPMRLSPLGDDQIDVLHALLEKHGAGPNSTRGPSGKYPAPGRTKSYRSNPRSSFETGDGPGAGADDDGSEIVGRTIGGKYKVEQALGAGAMGRVYRARHLALQKLIAVKVLHRKFHKDEQFAERFHREALAASRLDHPNVMRVIDFGDEGGLLYIAMELLTGSDLRMVLDASGIIAPGRAVEIMTQVCAALAVAHEAGIVHRDIKPENVVLISGRDDEGQIVEQVKVCDFGIAAVSATTEARATGTGGRRLTEEGALCGTPEYMAPEQARGGEIDARVDVYACGVMLYEMLTGVVPFTGPNYVSVLVAHASLQPRPPSALEPGIDRALEEVILKALAKDPGVRHQSARELRADLRAAMAGFDIDVAPHSVVPPPTHRSGTFEVEPPRELYAGPLEDPAAQFPELFVAFTAAVARSSYYDRGHPEFVRALSRLQSTMGPPLAGRGEISFARLDLPTGSVDLQLITGIGELLELKRVLPQGVASSHGPRLAEVFVRRHLVTVTIKEGITAEEMADCVELLAGPEVPVEQLRNQFLALGLRHVSVLFASDLLGRDRKLPWQVDLCIARLARDLRALPLLRGLDTAGLRRVRTQLIGDVLRMLRGSDQVRLLLANGDLIAASTRHVPELADLDLIAAIIHAIPHIVAVKLASALLSELELDSVQSDPRKQGPPPQRLLEVLARRFIKERTVESDDVLRTIHARAMVAYDDLPPDLQTWLRAEEQAGSLTRDPDELLRALDVPNDEEYAAALRSAGLAMRVLARRGEAVPLFVIVTRLEQLSRGARVDERTRGSLALRTLHSIGDQEALAKIAEVFLTGSADVRPSARGILLATGEPGARALVSARSRSPEKIGRGRFVEAMREASARALPILTSTFKTLDATTDGSFTEDLLRAIPDIKDDALAAEVARFLQHSAIPVRRAATGAISALWQGRAKHALLAAVEDSDEGVRIAAMAGLKKIGAMDVEVVKKIGKQLAHGTSDELRAVAAAALGVSQLAARAEALAVLTKAIEPRSRSVVSMFRGSEQDSDSTILLETIARSLIAIGGEEGRKAVEKRASKSGAELKSKLLMLLRR